MRKSVARAQLDGPPVLFLRSGPGPIVKKIDLSQCQVRTAGTVIELLGFRGRCFSNGKGISWRKCPQMAQPNVGISKAAMGSRPARLKANRSFEVWDSPPSGIGSDLIPKQMHAVEIVLVGLRVHRLGAGQQPVFLRSQFSSNLTGDRAGDLAVQFENITKIPIIAVGP